ncbi:hypothetical protein DPMN_101072 [Dreissena polymorpha]|uniref:Uncharacterized protein n=1 Tax=Dreissena polymorpha TaxID=45954 RepID=A0A9D4R801_DREPO|nr:hypothetical protein DPMN_101072 [Dreissena polymorpha]
MAECDHKEADTRLVSHLKNAIERAAKLCQIRTVDSDVVVILVGSLHSVKTDQLQLPVMGQFWKR